MDPVWAPECWITFLNKFAMAFMAGLLMRKLPAGRYRPWAAALGGSLTYSALYIAKNVLDALVVKGFTWQVTKVEVLAAKVPVTVVNGLLAVVCAVLLYLALQPALRKAHVLAVS